MPIDLAAVGRSCGPNPVRWTQRDAIIYALGVGAGSQDPAEDLEFTTENSTGIVQKVLPTFPLVVHSGAPPIPIGDFDRRMSVHGEQSLILHRPLPPEGTGSTVSEIEAIYDKGSGALVYRATTLLDHEGRKLATSRIGQFIRGEGGFGGERGPKAVWTVPQRPPDHVIEQPTRRDQALLYRLSGDQNPLHSDPVIARKAGFSQPILHGLCTFGFVGRAILSLVGGEPSRIGAMKVRFSSPVVPGDTLTTEFWRQGKALLFRTHADGRLALDGGEAEIL
ncbi:MAG: MaoC family dehydratase N-terminal domain-containing protein [Novosphingobium sp.]|nr:MaoC family dehydratase N-terminal domain-containing protein [Novosphingobium sp.]